MSKRARMLLLAASPFRKDFVTEYPIVATMSSSSASQTRRWGHRRYSERYCDLRKNCPPRWSDYSRCLRVALERIESAGRFSVRSRSHQTERVIREVSDETIRLDFLRETVFECFLDFMRLEELSDGDKIFQGGHAQMAYLAQDAQQSWF